MLLDLSLGFIVPNISLISGLSALILSLFFISAIFVLRTGKLAKSAICIVVSVIAFCVFADENLPEFTRIAAGFLLMVMVLFCFLGLVIAFNWCFKRLSPLSQLHLVYNFWLLAIFLCVPFSILNIKVIYNILFVDTVKSFMFTTVTAIIGLVITYLTDIFVWNKWMASAEAALEEEQKNKPSA